MGQSSSSNLVYNLPKNKQFKLSYCKHKNMIINDTVYPTEIDLSNILNTEITLIESVFYYKISHCGYSLDTFKLTDFNKKRLIDYFQTLRIIANSEFLTDLVIHTGCYVPNLNNIRYFLSKGSVLIAGIVLDNTLLSEVLNINEPFTGIITDIILIVGYTMDYIIIKTEWTSETINLDNKFLPNIRELWNIDIKSPIENNISNL